MKKIISGLLLTLAVGMAQAATSLINVQFSGTYTLTPDGFVDASAPPQVGAAVAGAAGDYWNSYAASALSGQALLDSSGAASGATLSFSSQAAYTSQLDYFAFYGQPAANLMQSYLYQVDNQNLLRATVSGLVAGQAYDLYLYTQGDNNSAGRSITFSVNGGVEQTSLQTNASTFILNDNYLLFHVAADGNGVIDIAETGFMWEGNLNGFQLQASAVPEPATGVMMMAGLGLLAALRRRRA